MDLLKIITFLILIILILLIIRIYKLENFNSINDLNTLSSDPKIKALKNVDIIKQFPDVLLFNNLTDKDKIITGLEQCSKYNEEKFKNKAKIVEMGQTSNCVLFPPLNISYGNFKQNSKKSNQDKDFEIINSDERNEDEPNNFKMSFIYY